MLAAAFIFLEFKIDTDFCFCLDHCSSRFDCEFGMQDQMHAKREYRDYVWRAVATRTVYVFKSVRCTG